MRKLVSGSLILFMLVSLALIAGCSGGAKTCKPLDIHDTAENHYFGARRSLMNPQTGIDVKAEFDRAICLDPEFAPAYEGLGYYYFTQNDMALAAENFQMALSKDPNWIPAYTGLGRIAAASGNYSEAYDNFDKALKLDLTDASGITDRLADRTKEFQAEAKYEKGITLQQEGKLTEACEIFTELRQDSTVPNEFIDKSKTAWLENKVMTTSKKGLGANYPEIVKKSAVNREELAAVLINELPAEKVARTRGESDLTNEIIDVDGSWAKIYIQKAVEGKLMRTAPNGAFDPNRPITRAELAQAILFVFANAHNDDSILTEYANEDTPFYDLTKSHFAYAAVMYATRNGYMTPDKGTFGISNEVSGDELFWTIDKIAKKF